MWQQGELSLAYLTVDGASPVEHIETAAASGFEAAGLRILPPSHLSAAASVVGDPQEVRRLSRLCRSLGVTPLDAEVMTLRADTDSSDLRAFVSAAAKLGFRFVQTVVEDEDMDRALGNLALLADEASQAELRVALEFMAFRPLKNLEAALTLIDRSGADNVGLMIDALHLARSGGKPDQVAAIPASKVAVVQLCDAPADAPAGGDLATEARCGRLHPGDGSLPLDALLDALPDGIPLSVEVPHPTFSGRPFVERAQEALRALQRFLVKRAQRQSDSQAAGMSLRNPASRIV